MSLSALKGSVPARHSASLSSPSPSLSVPVAQRVASAATSAASGAATSAPRSTVASVASGRASSGASRDGRSKSPTSGRTPASGTITSGSAAHAARPTNTASGAKDRSAAPRASRIPARRSS